LFCPLFVPILYQIFQVRSKLCYAIIDVVCSGDGGEIYWVAYDILESGNRALCRFNRPGNIRVTEKRKLQPKGEGVKVIADNLNLRLSSIRLRLVVAISSALLNV